MDETTVLRESAARDVGEAMARLPGVWKIRKGGIANDIVVNFPHPGQPRHRFADVPGRAFTQDGGLAPTSRAALSRKTVVSREEGGSADTTCIVS
jgi:hypothetical protein